MRFKEQNQNFFNMQTKTSNQITIMKLEREEIGLQKKLDYLLFENINKSNLIF